MLKSEKNEQDRQLQTLKKELKSLAETEDKLKVCTYLQTLSVDPY